MFRKLLLSAALMFGAASSQAVWAAGIDYSDSGLTPTRFVQYQGLNVAVYESAGTAGPGILFVHGNTSSANAFAEVFRSNFAQNRKVVLMDLPGYGASDNAAANQYSVSFTVGAIAAVANATGTQAGVLSGWSLGAVYAVQATQQLPQLKGLFLFGDAVASLDPNLPPPFLSPQQSYAGEAVNYGTVGNLTPIQLVDYVNYFFAPNFGRVPRYILKDGLRTDPNTRTAVLNILIGIDPIADPVALLANATFKIALVNGEKDAFVNNARYAALEGLFPTLFRHKTIFINNVGHAPHIEKTNRFIDILSSFVQAL